MSKSITQDMTYRQSMKIPYSENILRGRVFCANCGKNLHRQRSHGRYFYRCISNDRMGEGSCTGGIIHLPEPDLFDAILTIIRQKAEVVMGEALRLKRCDNKIAAQKAQVDQEIAELERQMERCTSMADKLAAVDKDTTLSALLVEQLIERVTVNGPDNVSVKFSFEGGFERVMEVLGNE